MTLVYVMAIMAWVYTYDMDSVHNGEPERSRVTIKYVIYDERLKEHGLTTQATRRLGGGA